MPTIIVQTHNANGQRRTVTLLERALPVSLHSEHYREQLIQRLAWALLDAEQLEAERGEAAAVRTPQGRWGGRDSAAAPPAARQATASRT
jgi:hypothetical protein